MNNTQNESHITKDSPEKVEVKQSAGNGQEQTPVSNDPQPDQKTTEAPQIAEAGSEKLQIPVPEEEKNDVGSPDQDQEENAKYLAIRAKEGLFYMDYKTPKLSTYAPLLKNCSISLFTPDGKFLISSDAEGLHMFDTWTSELKQTVKITGIQMAAFSAGGNYIQVWYRPDKEWHNISVVQVSTFTIIKTFSLQRFKKEYWPLLKFSADDQIVYKMNKDSVEILSVPAFTKTEDISTDIVDILSVSPSKTQRFIACGTLQDLNNRAVLPKVVFFDLGPKRVTFTAMIEKAHECSFIWSPDGEVCLVWSQTLHDETGRSYYGEHKLYLYHTQNGTFTTVPKAEGPVHDVSWNAQSQSFALLSGFMPASAVLMDKSCTVKHDFGKMYVNTIRWSPQSRFLLLGGFGNLSGNIQVWDSFQMEKVGECRALSAIVCQWAPDGRKFFTAIINPRLRVDNHYRVFKYDGTLMHVLDLKSTELYEVLWQPGEYTDKPISPRKWSTMSEPSENKSKPKRILKLRNEDDFVKPERKGSGQVGDEEKGGNEAKNSEQKKKTWKEKLSNNGQPMIFKPSANEEVRNGGQQQRRGYQQKPFSNYYQG